MASTQPADNDHLAEKLKKEGNALFVDKKYAQAIEKYSEALQVGGDNALLYSNRSACRMKLKNYLYAESDASKANPSFAKGYARLATAQTALREPYLSMQSWDKALDKLPKTNLNLLDLKRRSEYTTSRTAALHSWRERKLETAERIREWGQLTAELDFEDLPWIARTKKKFSTKWKKLRGKGTDLPWVVCAKKIMPRLIKEKDWSSCAWTLTRAHKSLVNGVRAYKHRNFLMALTLMSNAILTDYRVFQVQDLYDIKAVFENCGSYSREWPENSPLDLIQSEVLKHLDVDGVCSWDAIRPALDITVRVWICDAFFRGRYDDNLVAEAEYLAWAVDLIQWGRQQFTEVNKEVRGEIFEIEFLRCVQKLHIRALRKGFRYMDASALEEALRTADQLISDINAQPTPSRKTNPAKVAASYYHPKGEAFRLKGVYYMVKDVENMMETFQEFQGVRMLLQFLSPDYTCLLRSYENFVKAAKCVGEDDELHVAFLSYAAATISFTPRTARLRPILERIRRTLPKRSNIWERSFLGDSRDACLYEVMSEDERSRFGVTRGY
ncbi:hypothetical protein BT96DRAFT_970688 [Gymnopus androsaceus JB14]|uniref:Uncharacterized protein n=1 Tax=Gymnopus androsaceus JB14 TaxID=1447944 RepID=A0A6A4IGY9_9AGAR|nr:hypothetical protein BT96DRAFT_970688 [Gymnopus androsaceus JB14]